MNTNSTTLIERLKSGEKIPLEAEENYVIAVNGGFITRTKFRPYGGTIVVHPDIARAAVFKKKKHADTRAEVMRWRADTYTHDAKWRGADIRVLPFAEVVPSN